MVGRLTLWFQKETLYIMVKDYMAGVLLIGMADLLLFFFIIGIYINYMAGVFCMARIYISCFNIGHGCSVEIYIKWQWWNKMHIGYFWTMIYIYTHTYGGQNIFVLNIDTTARSRVRYIYIYIWYYIKVYTYVLSMERKVDIWNITRGNGIPNRQAFSYDMIEW